MNEHVNSISQRMSLRPPQHESLKILDRIAEMVGINEEAWPE